MLHEATMDKNVAMAQLLLKHDADPRAKDRRERTALERARARKFAREDESYGEIVHVLELAENAARTRDG